MNEEFFSAHPDDVPPDGPGDSAEECSREPVSQALFPVIPAPRSSPENHG